MSIQYKRIRLTCEMDVEYLNTILRSIEAVEGIFIVLSNILVLGLFYEEGIRGRLSNCHIISLMASDVLQGLINVPAVIYLTLDLRVGDKSCFWTIWIATTSAFTQIFIILCMTVDRYWAIVHTMHYRCHVTKEITQGMLHLLVEITVNYLGFQE